MTNTSKGFPRPLAAAYPGLAMPNDAAELFETAEMSSPSGQEAQREVVRRIQGLLDIDHQYVYPLQAPYLRAGPIKEDQSRSYLAVEARNNMRDLLRKAEPGTPYVNLWSTAQTVQLTIGTVTTATFPNNRVESRGVAPVAILEDAAISFPTNPDIVDFRVDTGSRAVQLFPKVDERTGEELTVTQTLEWFDKLARGMGGLVLGKEITPRMAEECRQQPMILLYAAVGALLNNVTNVEIKFSKTVETAAQTAVLEALAYDLIQPIAPALTAEQEKEFPQRPPYYCFRSTPDPVRRASLQAAKLPLEEEALEDLLRNKILEMNKDNRIRGNEGKTALSTLSGGFARKLLDRPRST